MNIKIRRALAVLFITGFLISAPILILSTAGYRYSWKKQQVSKTGTLVLASEPKGATITLISQIVDGKTPARITNLFPGDYQIKIEKSGYFAWEKKLTVYAQQTTFAENITLFKNNQSEKIISEKIFLPVISPDKKQLLYLSEKNNELKALDLTEQTTKTIFHLDIDRFSIKEISPSFKNQAVLIKTQSNNHSGESIFYLVKFHDAPQEFNLSQSYPTLQFNQLSWDSTENNFYFLNDHDLYQGKLLITGVEIQKIKTLDPTEKTQDLLIDANYLNLIVEKNNETYIKSLPLADAAPLAEKNLRLNFANYKFRGILKNLIALENLDQTKVYFLGTDLTEVLFEKDDLIDYSFNEKENKLLLFSDNELSIINFNDDYFETTVTRLSGGIVNAEWHKDSNYLFFLQKNQINLIELDERDQKNQITYPDTQINFASFDNTRKKIFFTKQTEPGLFELKIAD